MIQFSKLYFNQEQPGASIKILFVYLVECYLSLWENGNLIGST